MMDFRVAFGLTLLAAGLAAVPVQGADPATVRLAQSAEPGGRIGNANAAVPAIQLLNDLESGGDVRFLVNGREYSLQPGETLDLPNDVVQTVDFNSGGPAGDRRFSLYSGLYKFKVMDDGWMLFKSNSPPVRTAARGPSAAAGVPTPPEPHPELARRRRSTSGSPAAPAATSTEEPRAVPKPPAPGSAAVPAGSSTSEDSSAPVPRRNSPPDAEEEPQTQELKAPAASSETPPPPPTASSEPVAG